MLQPRAARACLEVCAVLRCSSQLGARRRQLQLDVTPESEPPRRGFHPGTDTALACRVACVGGVGYAAALAMGAGLKVAFWIGFSGSRKRHDELADEHAAFLHQGAGVRRSYSCSIEEW